MLSSSSPIIRLEEVVFCRGSRKIFDSISCTINKGEIIAVVGPSGDGKTTLMRLLTGQLQPDSGKITVFNQIVNHLSYKDLMAMRRRMSMLFQSNALFSDMTVAENIAFPLKEVLNLPQELIDIIVAMKLYIVGLHGIGHLMPSELSGGMARRVALARAIAMDPQIMIYDEPFTGQDPITLGILIKLVKELNAGLEMTSLVITHNIATINQFADRVLLISDGKIVAFEGPDVLFSSKDPFISQFMQGVVLINNKADDYVRSLREGEFSRV